MVKLGLESTAGSSNSGAKAVHTGTCGQNPFPCFLGLCTVAGDPQLPSPQGFEVKACRDTVSVKENKSKGWKFKSKSELLPPGPASYSLITQESGLGTKQWEGDFHEVAILKHFQNYAQAALVPLFIMLLSVVLVTVVNCSLKILMKISRNKWLQVWKYVPFWVAWWNLAPSHPILPRTCFIPLSGVSTWYTLPSWKSLFRSLDYQIKYHGIAVLVFKDPLLNFVIAVKTQKWWY